MNKTGYPAIDKPWMKYYDEKICNITNPQKTIYDYFEAKINKIQDHPATTFFNVVTYGEMIEKVDEAAKALASIGIKKNDRVLQLLPNIPTTSHLFYANSKIGSVSDYYDPRPDSFNPEISKKKLMELVKREKINYIILLDACYEPFIMGIENELKDIGINKIIIVSIMDSISLDGSFEIDKLNEKELNKIQEQLIKIEEINNKIEMAKKTSPIEIIRYNELIENSRYQNYIKNEYEKDHMELIVHTSGTSGALPKPLPLTSDNLNIHIDQLFAAKYEFSNEDKVFHLLPYFASFGLADNAHFAFCSGSNLIEIPEFTPESLPLLIMKNKPQIVILAPELFNPILESPIMQNTDLSFLKRLIFGGGDLPREEEIREFLDHNKAQKCSIDKGHGMSEISGSGSLSYGDHNIIGGIGAPLPFTTYMLVDPVTKKPIKFNENVQEITGDAWISSPCSTPGILDGKIIVPHYEYKGQDFIDSGDLLTMDKNGNMKFATRLDRTFPRFDGYKYKPYVIEKVLLSNPNVSECVIVEYEDQSKKGNMPIAHIVLKNNDLSLDEQYEIIKEIVYDNLLNNPEISTRQIPSKIKIREFLPLTPNSKINYQELKREEIDGSEFDVILDETNMAVSSVTVNKPTIKKLVRK
jgi:long-chain acyl-CoA synthetase